MNTSATERAFTKMHGLGNDFVVFDARSEPLALSVDQARLVADRHDGVGCDQVITLLPSQDADVFMRVQNADGSEVGACGNATRCVAKLIGDGDGDVLVETQEAVLSCRRAEGDMIAVDLGEPRLAWQSIPLAREMDTLHGEHSEGPLSDPAFVNVGNPHIIFFVEDADAVDLATLGPKIETDPLFPERINVNVVSLDGPDALRLRTWERGTGLTMACGTGASASTVAAIRRELTGRAVTVRLDGGTLNIEWRDDDHVIMTGEAETSYQGHLSL